MSSNGSIDRILLLDIQHRLQQQILRIEVHLTENVINEALTLLEDKVLQLGGKTLSEYGLPAPNREEVGAAQEIIRETSYNINNLENFISFLFDLKLKFISVSFS